MTINELNSLENNLFSAFNDLKSEIRRRDKTLYEQWKAGGFLIDSNVVSMYPNAEDVIAILQDEIDDENDEGDEY